MKLTLVRLYKDEDVPDHILEEVNRVSEQIAEFMDQLHQKHNSNILLSALNRAHAATVVGLISENDLKNAARTEAIGLIKNIEHVSGQKDLI